MPLMISKYYVYATDKKKLSWGADDKTIFSLVIMRYTDPSPLLFSYDQGKKILVESDYALPPPKS